MHYLYQNQINETELDFPSSTSTSQLNLKIYVDFSFILWHTYIQVCQIPLTKLQEPQVLTRSKTATLFELDCILHRAAKLTDRNFTIFPPSDEDGNLLVDETIEYYKKEIIKTINQIKTEEPQ